MNPSISTKIRVLLVDDDAMVRNAYTRELSISGSDVVPVDSGEAAVALLQKESFDVVVSDVMMPGMSGLDLLRAVRSRDLDTPVILMTGVPMVDSAIQAVDYGALRYLTKPVDAGELPKAVKRAGQLVRVARAEREMVKLAGGSQKLAADRAGLEANFERAIAGVKMVFQPIVSMHRKTVFAYEALLRSTEPSLGTPPLLLDAAERLDSVHRLGRAIRAGVASALAASPVAHRCFVNLHPADLTDDDLYARGSPLTAFATRVTLEITERHSLESVPAVRDRMTLLRSLGYRIAIDDLGAGYAGLASFAQLEPQVVKLDMSLVRNVHAEPTKRKLVQSMVQLCRELGLEVICEGVETAQERDALLALECDLLQGYFFARPGPPFPEVDFGR